MGVVEIVVMLALAWLMANAALVLMLRRNARARERGARPAPSAGRGLP
jgi:hypothetical protein